MNNSFIKKIVCAEEAFEVSKDLSEVFEDQNKKYGHALNLKHDINLITKSIAHDSILTWNMHVWAHFNGKKWDAVFIGLIRKSEKFNQKIMEEYLWISQRSNSGLKLYNTALNFAKENGCHHIVMSLTSAHPVANKLRRFYFSQGFELDSEVFYKKL